MFSTILELVFNKKLYTGLRPAHTSLRKVIFHCIIILNTSLSKAIDVWNIKFRIYYVLCQQCLLHGSSITAYSVQNQIILSILDDINLLFTPFVSTAIVQFSIVRLVDCHCKDFCYNSSTSPEILYQIQHRNNFKYNFWSFVILHQLYLLFFLA